MTVQKPATRESADDAHVLENGDTQRLIEEALDEVAAMGECNPSHVYAKVLRKAIQEHYMLDGLHLSDVLLALRSAGYRTNEKTGLMTLQRTSQHETKLA